MNTNEKTGRPSLDRQSEKSTTALERCVRVLTKSVELQRQQIRLLAHLTDGPFHCPERLELFSQDVGKAESVLNECVAESLAEAEASDFDTGEEPLFVHAHFLGDSSFPTVNRSHVVWVEGATIFVIKAEFRHWYDDVPWVRKSASDALAFFEEGSGN